MIAGLFGALHFLSLLPSVESVTDVRLPLMQHGACVNAMDLWQFTPLHESASKNRVEVCSLLLSHGADPTLVNCHGKSAVDMAPTPELRERLTCEYLYPEPRGPASGDSSAQAVSSPDHVLPLTCVLIYHVHC